MENILKYCKSNLAEASTVKVSDHPKAVHSLRFKTLALKQRTIRSYKQRNKKGEKQRTSNIKEAGSLESVFSLLLCQDLLGSKCFQINLY